MRERAEDRRRRYPRPGEPILPRLLRALVLERHLPAKAQTDAESDLLGRVDLGPNAWKRLPAETCRRLSLLVLDRVQTRLSALPEVVRRTHLPDPQLLGSLPLERRTVNTLTRAAMGERPRSGPWTVDDYLAIRRFGGRALIDVLSALEVSTPPAARDLAQGAVPHSEASPTSLEDLLKAIAPRLPTSEEQLNLELTRERRIAQPLDLMALLRTTVKLGWEAPFCVVRIGGKRTAVRLSEVTAAMTTYRIAVRAVQSRGATTIGAVAAQLETTAGRHVDQIFVDRLLVGSSRFRWLDRNAGWFWFVDRSNPLVVNLNKVLAVTSRLALRRLWAALFRVHRGPPLSDEAVAELTAATPGARVADGDIVIDRPTDPATKLSDQEQGVLRLLATAATPVSLAELRQLARRSGMTWPAVLRQVRRSSIVERVAPGLFQIIGSGGPQLAIDSALARPTG